MHWFTHFFGLDNPGGLPYLAWSGVVGSGLLTALGAHFHRKLSRHHNAVIAQAERHHLERQAQATAHHNALLHLAEKHHRQALDQAEGHHEAAKAHLTAMLRLPVKTPRTPAAKGGE